MTAIWKICSGVPWISKNKSPKPSPTSHLSEVLTPIDPYLVWVRQGQPGGNLCGVKTVIRGRDPIEKLVNL